MEFVSSGRRSQPSRPDTIAAVSRLYSRASTQRVAPFWVLSPQSCRLTCAHAEAEIHVTTAIAVARIAQAWSERLRKSFDFRPPNHHHEPNSPVFVSFQTALMRVGILLRRPGIILAGLMTFLVGACSSVPEGVETKSQPALQELMALVECEQAVLGTREPNGRIRTGIFDMTHAQWVIVGEKRTDIVNCLVMRYGWTGLSLPEGGRGAKAPR